MFKLFYGDPAASNTINYQLEGNDSWIPLTYSETLVLNKNQRAKFKMDNPTIVSLTYGPRTLGIGTFHASKKYNVKGNVMSLLYGDDFKGKTDLTGKDAVFSRLFAQASDNQLIDASDLILPATTLS